MTQKWQQFADAQQKLPYLSFAQFDARYFPIRENSLDCLDSTGAMSEIHDSYLAIQEAFRTLKSGGTLHLSGGMLYPECAQEFPEEGRMELVAIRFDVDSLGYRDQLIKSGFEIDTYTQWGPRTPNLEQSTLAEIAEKYGVTIRTISVEAVGRKP